MKIEQIAIASNNPQALIQMLGAVLGLNNWSTDIVKSKAVVFGFEGENTAELNFNYDLGFELEIIKYTEGPNWHQSRIKPFGDEPFLSHIGYHCTEEEAQEKIKELAASGIVIAQEVWTQSHTNPVIAGKRQYHYIVFDSIDAFGFDLKLIVRKDIDNEEAAI